MRSALKIFFIWLPIFFIGMIVCAICYGRITVNENLAASQRWFPQYSVGLLNKNERLLRPNLSLHDSQEIHANAIQGLKKSPLSHRPYVHLGEVSVFMNDRSTSRVLFSEVMRRNSRNRRALRAMVNLDVHDKNFGAAIHNLDTLSRLQGKKERLDEYQEVLLFLSEDKEAIKQIDGYLAERPIWGRKFLHNRIGVMTENNFLNIGDSLNRYSASNVEGGADRDLHEYYMSNLQRLRKIDAAYAHWTSLADGAGVEKKYTVFNPDFDKRTEFTPFNWSEVDKREYFSEVDPGEGLYASYADSEVRVLTEQTTRLRPGQVYRLDIDADWSYKDRQGLFFWYITCFGNGLVISGVNLDDNAKERSGGQHDFQVPLNECDAQILRLAAKPGQYSQRIWSRTKSVNVILLQ